MLDGDDERTQAPDPKIAVLEKELADLQTGETQRSTRTERKTKGKTEGTAKDFQKYVRRLVKDLEMKGTIRTAVEGINLSLHANHPDVLMA